MSTGPTFSPSLPDDLSLPKYPPTKPPRAAPAAVPILAPKIAPAGPPSTAPNAVPATAPTPAPTPAPCAAPIAAPGLLPVMVSRALAAFSVAVTNSIICSCAGPIPLAMKSVIALLAAMFACTILLWLSVILSAPAICACWSLLISARVLVKLFSANILKFCCSAKFPYPLLS